MLDRYVIPYVKRPLHRCSLYLFQLGITANQITLTGFVVGMCVLPLLYLQNYGAALAVILFNRVCDGLDGELARLSGPTDQGAFLDICLDFIFYSAVVFGFVLADPLRNGFAGALLIFSFMGTGSTFLAFAVMAEKRKLKSSSLPNKGFYYLNGIAEGTETIIMLIVFCLFPACFSELAFFFAFLCLVTTLSRLVSGYLTLA